MIASLLTLLVITGSNADVHCPETDNKDPIYIPDPTNCSRFYECSLGNSYLFECPENLEFNAILQVCDYPEFAQCHISTTPTKTTGTTIPSTRSTEPISTRTTGRTTTPKPTTPTNITTTPRATASTNQTTTPTPTNRTTTTTPSTPSNRTTTPIPTTPNNRTTTSRPTTRPVYT